MTGCAAAPVDEAEDLEGTGTQASAIIKGARDDASTWVVGVSGCTGVYVGGGVVLTAGHCIKQTAEPRAIVVIFQTSATTLGSVPATGVSTLAPIPTSDDAMKEGKDLAVVTIDKCRVPAGIAPSPGFLTSVNGLSGEKDRNAKVQVIGLGRTETEPYGYRNQGDANITVVTEKRISILGNPARPAPGDSGGPLLIDRNGTKLIAGILSFVSSDGSGTPQYTRVDVAPASDFIAGAVLAATLGAVSSCGGKGEKCSTGAGSSASSVSPVAPLACAGAVAALVVRRRRRRVSAAVAAAGLLSCTSACSSQEDPPRDCEELASAYARAAARCGVGTYEAARAQLITSAALGSCDNVVEVRDEESLRSRCVPSFGTLSCDDLRAGKLDPTCTEQLVRE